MKTIRLGAGAAFQGDRIDPAVELAKKGEIQYLVFECLAERTIALAQQRKLKDPKAGHDDKLKDRLEAVLPICIQKGIKIITNMGAANPLLAARKAKEIAESLGLTGIKIAAVTGDDVLDTMLSGDYTLLETGAKLSTVENIVSANAYIGAQPIVEALENGADVIITGRVADPALYLAPMIYEFKWSFDDYDLLGKGAMIGHLLECSGQVTGGYFADPGYKDVADLARLGFPIAEVYEDGNAIITKVPGSGGTVTVHTVKEQLIYEVMDPARYITPDVVADITDVKLTQMCKDSVLVEGIKGTPRTDTLKVSVGYLDGYIGEGQLSYGGAGAVARARLALDIVRERLEKKIVKIDYQEVKYDLIGVNSLYGEKIPAWSGKEPFEVRIRVAVKTKDARSAEDIGYEVIALTTNGPAGGGGLFQSIKQVVGIVSCLVPRDLVKPNISYEVV